MCTTETDACAVYDGQSCNGVGRQIPDCGKCINGCYDNIWTFHRSLMSKVNLCFHVLLPDAPVFICQRKAVTKCPIVVLKLTAAFGLAFQMLTQCQKYFLFNIVCFWLSWSVFYFSTLPYSASLHLVIPEQEETSSRTRLMKGNHLLPPVVGGERTGKRCQQTQEVISSGVADVRQKRKRNTKLIAVITECTCIYDK